MNKESFDEICFLRFFGLFFQNISYKYEAHTHTSLHATLRTWQSFIVHLLFVIQK